MRNWLYWPVVFIAAFTLLFKVADRVVRRGATLPKIPSPNAYEDLLRLAEKLPKFQAEPSEMSREEAMRMAENERSILEPIHLLVRTNSAVRLKTSTRWGDDHQAEIKMLKRVAVALAMQARVHEVAGNTNMCARSFVELIFLGELMARGGIHVDGVSSLVVEMIGTTALRPKVRSLDAPTCRWAARELEWLEERRESADAILEREKIWENASFGLISRVDAWLGRTADAERRSKFSQKYNDSMLRTRRLILALAAHAFELEKNQTISNPEQLVPGFLRAVPIDPITKNAMKEIPRLEVGL